MELSNLNYLLVTTTCLVTIGTAIRVDWNTNTGPIIPPTPRTTVRPIPPYREPAPVWEDLSNDIPNPNPYIYVPPPPSRPKQRLNTDVNYNINGNNNYGRIITPQNAPNYYQQNNNSPRVASLSPQYITNIGTQYVAVVPKTFTTSKFPQASTNTLSPNGNISYKLQGKYNAKTKKYKAYEKVKNVPLNYQRDTSYEASSMHSKLQTKSQQDLPYVESSLKFNALKEWPTTASTTVTATVTKEPSTTTSTISKMSLKSYTKHAYVKDALVKAKDKHYKNVIDTAKKS